MSIRSCCSKDSVVVYLKVATRGNTLGTKYSLLKVATLACRGESLSADQIAKFSAVGMRATHRFMFADNPEVTIQNYFEWNGSILHVTGVNDQGRPGEVLMWVVMAELETTRDRIKVEEPSEGSGSSEESGASESDSSSNSESSSESSESSYSDESESSYSDESSSSG